MIYRNLLLLMQRIQHSVIDEHYYYVMGEIDEMRFTDLEKKFDFSYDVRLSRQSRYRRRKNGEAVSKLHAIKISGKIWFILMATSGAGRIHVLEHLLDARNSDNRIVSPTSGYELVHDGVGWSWRMTKIRYKWYRERIHLAAALPPNRRRSIEIDNVVYDAHAEKIQDGLYSEPGFRLVRRQVGALKVYLYDQWKRLRPSSGPQARQRTFLPYVRFLPIEEKEQKDDLYRKLNLPLSDLVATEFRRRLNSE